MADDDQTIPDAVEDDALSAIETALLRDVADAGGIAQTQTETENVRNVDPLVALKAVQLARELRGEAPRRARTFRGTTYLASRSPRRGWY